jgi:hypothetical protein
MGTESGSTLFLNRYMQETRSATITALIRRFSRRSQQAGRNATPIGMGNAITHSLTAAAEICPVGVARSITPRRLGDDSSRCDTVKTRPWPVR